MCFLHSTFLNRDCSLDIIQKCIKILTVILTSVLEGIMSHSFDVGLKYFVMAFRKKVKIIFYNFLRFT